ncbi:MAG: hypothetical protein Q8M83_06830 [bacterium]|nr:hypothetical protein [bacterium]
MRAVRRSAARCVECSVDLGAVAAARAVGPFEGVLAKVIHACKYARRPSIATGLGRMMRALAATWPEPIDVVVPVPLHPRRERERGFNQAALLAAALGTPVCEPLTRRVHTPPQVAGSGVARHANVRGAFALGRDAAVVRAGRQPGEAGSQPEKGRRPARRRSESGCPDL